MNKTFYAWSWAKNAHSVLLDLLNIIVKYYAIMEMVKKTKTILVEKKKNIFWIYGMPWLI